jgi:RNA polymerase sigma-70 factor (ECF subfamily)
VGFLDPALEAAYLDRIQRGGEDARRAASELSSALRAPLVRLCRNVTGDAFEAEDAAQEALLSMHRALATFRGGARLSTWVYQIGLRAALRRRRLRPTEALDEALPSEALAPDEAASQSQAWDRVMAAMSTLSAEQHAVLALFAVDGLGHGQIAEVLGVPEGTVWSRLHTARKRLRAALGEG